MAYSHVDLASRPRPELVRDAVPVERDAKVLFVCFASATLRNDVKLQVDRFGVSSVASFRAVDVREHHREEGPEWFDNWRSGPLRAVAVRKLSCFDDQGPKE